LSIETVVNLLKARRTKVMATLGPASADPETISGLIEAGVNVFRLNMSHGNYEAHRVAYDRVREAGRKSGFSVAVLADLCGPKARIGRIEGGKIEIADGESLIVTTREIVGRPGLVPSQYKQLANDVVPGDRILIDDGNLELRVIQVDGTEIATEVTRGGTLSERKGLNLPGVRVSSPALTDKDREDVRFGLEIGVDMFALSFVRQADDVRQLKQLLDELGERTPVIAKIERAEALAEIEEILEVCDGIMVARGDLGVELAPEEVPVVQDQLIECARRVNKPVVVATQMLDSMTRNRRPTRAEVTDVANSVKSGVDAVLLSGETAVGAHPIEVVKMLDRILRHTEGYLWEQGAFRAISMEVGFESPIPLWAAVGEATAQLSRDLAVRAIVVVSRTGATARMVAAARPAAPIVAVSADAQVSRCTNLLWGVIPMKVSHEEMGRPTALARRLVVELDLAERGHTILLVRGYHELPELNQPTLSVIELT
jgi:pyruvate kinase